jgi:hypothetical protein
MYRNDCIKSNPLLTASPYGFLRLTSGDLILYATHRIIVTPRTATPKYVLYHRLLYFPENEHATYVL